MNELDGYRWLAADDENHKFVHEYKITIVIDVARFYGQKYTQHTATTTKAQFDDVE
jgi:hypothetical protein